MKITLAGIAASLLLATAPAIAGEPLWVQIGQLYGSDTDSGDAFGERLSIDGETLVVAAWRKSSGVVYVFERLPGVPTRWQEVKRLTPAPGDNNFGLPVTVSGDTIAVRAATDGDEAVPATYIYERDAGGPGQWGFVARFELEQQGPVVIAGDTLALGDIWADVGRRLDAGVVYVFGRDPADDYVWHPITTLSASDPHAQDHFGDTLALSRGRMMIGATQVGDLGLNAGAAYLLERDESGVWIEVEKLLASDGNDQDRFGSAIGLDAETAIVGAHETNATYIFERAPTGDWREIRKLFASDGSQGDAFGVSVAISGNVAVAGARGHDLPDVLAAGAAYIFERDQGGVDAWGEVTKIVAADPQEFDAFGQEIDLAGNTLVVGVRSDDDIGSDAGTVHLFSRTAPLLAVTGTCPGELDVSVIGTTPVGQVDLLGAESEGSTSIPVGPCAGTEVNLDHPKVLFVGTATSGGDLALTPIVGQATCGRYLQAVDVETCVTSDVRQIP